MMTNASQYSIRYEPIRAENRSTMREFERPPMNQAQFDEQYADMHEKAASEQEGVVSRLARRCVRPCSSGRALLHTAVSFIPIVSWLPRYSWKENLTADIVGGITTGIMHIPQGIAYSSLAGVPPVYGLYASCFPAFFYMFFGGSRHASLGSFAVIALMAGVANDKVLDGVGGGSSDFLLSSNGTMVETGRRGAIDPVAVATTLTLALGVWQILFGLLRLQFVMTYFSDQLVSGFTTGAGVHVLVAQFDDILGIKVRKVSGAGYLFKRIIDLAFQIADTNLVTLGVSILSILFLHIGKEYVSPFVKRRFGLKIPIPYELILVILTTVFSSCLKLSALHDVSVVDKIPTGMPAPAIPNLSIFYECFVNCIGIAIVSTAIHVSMSKMLAKKDGYRIDPGQECYALGLSACLGSLFPVYPVSTALGRTMVNVNSGTKTQFSTVFSSGFLLVIILLVGPLLEPLPMCVLASIIVVALRSMFQKSAELRRLATVSKIDLAIWLVAFLVTVCVDVMEGLAAAIAFALLTVVFRTQWPRWQKVIRNDDDMEYLESNGTANICVLRFDSPLLFTNADSFKKAVARTMDEWAEREKASHRVRFLIVDCSSVAYVDAMGVQAMEEVYKETTTAGVFLYFAAANGDVRSVMRSSGFLDRVSMESLFPTLRDAVAIANMHCEDLASSGDGDEERDELTDVKVVGGGEGEAEEEEEKEAVDLADTISLGESHKGRS